MFQVKKNRSSCHLAVNVMVLFASQISDEETRENRLPFTSAEQPHLATRGVIDARFVCGHLDGRSQTRTPPQGTDQVGHISSSVGSHNLHLLPSQCLNYLPSFAFSNQFCPVHNG